MADPITAMTVISMGATIAGTATSALGASQSASAQANMANYRAGLAGINQKIALQNADYERDVGEVKAQQSGMRTKAQVSGTRAIQAAGNIDINSGSAARVQKSEQEIGYEDQAIIRSNSARRAYGYEVEAAGQKGEATLDTLAGQQALRAGKINMASSILGGVSSVSSKWLQAKQFGMVPSASPAEVGDGMIGGDGG